MGKLADIVRQEVLKPAITKIGPHAKGDPIFKSDAFRGFSGFLSDEPQEEEFNEFQLENEKMMSIFAIMRMLMKMMD